MDKEKEEERRKRIIEKLDSLSSGKSSFLENRPKNRSNLRRFTRKRYIERRANELYPLSSTKDLKNKLQKDSWTLGYNEALKVIIDYFEDKEVIDFDATFFAKVQILSNKEEMSLENINKYKKIFEDIIDNFLLKRIKDTSENDSTKN